MTRPGCPIIGDFHGPLATAMTCTVAWCNRKNIDKNKKEGISLLFECVKMFWSGVQRPAFRLSGSAFGCGRNGLSTGNGNGFHGNRGFGGRGLLLVVSGVEGCAGEVAAQFF